jgi:DNA polymerase
MKKKEFKNNLLNELHTQYTQQSNLGIEGGSTKIIFGEGNPDARLLLIGEAPGAQEDLEGRPFVGRSGKLLNKLLQQAGTQREEVFITNIVKCRPPNNRKPTAKEMDKSRDLLLKQIKIIQPSIICTLGSSALEGLMGKSLPITKLRGKIFQWEHVAVMPTYHPAFVLRNPKEETTLAQDIKQACMYAHGG